MTVHALVFAAAVGCGEVAHPSAAAPPGSAEPPIPTPAVPADPASWHMERVADGIYAYLGPPGVTPIVSGNSVVIIGDDGVIVVDTGQLPSIARREIDEIRKLTDRPVRYVVSTHWHPDHWVGNGEFRRAYPGATFVATPNTRAMARTKAQPFISIAYTRNTIAAVRPMLDKGIGPDGKPLRAITRAYLTLGIAQLDEYGGELATAQLAPPSATFEDALTVWLGKREVDVRFLGRGNTGGDAIVWVPDAKLLATGDLIVSPYPYAIGSFIGEWSDTLDRLDEFGATTIIPGHGPVMHDLSYAHAVRDLLRDLQAQVKTAVARGSSLDDTRAAIKLDAAQAALCKGDPWCKNGFASVFAAPAHSQPSTPRGALPPAPPAKPAGSPRPSDSLRSSKTPPLPASPMEPANYRTVKLADGVYAFIAPIETNVVSGNSLLVVGDDGAVVVDTQQFAAVARWEVAEIRRLTDQPVRYVVNTHWHNDHWLGNATFREAWPDAMFLATPNTRRLVIEKGVADVDPSKASEQLAQLDAMLADRKRKLAPLARRYLQVARDELRDYIPAMTAARPEPPSATFDRAFTIHLGAREVDVRFLGRGNTGGDAVVYIPDAKVVATGDLVVHPVPFAFGSFISEWPSTLGKLAELDAKTIVPGHGELQHDMQYVRALAAALGSISAQARVAQTAGKSLEQARKTVDVRSFERDACGDDPWCHLGFPGAFVQPAFDRAFREAKEGPLRDENEN